MRHSRSLPVRDPNAWAQLPELADFDVYAGDGHFHAAAAHDHPLPGSLEKDAVGHFYAYNLKTDALTHLAVAKQDKKHNEHDTALLKRLPAQQLRHDAPIGRKVIYVWDRAGIEFAQWSKVKKSRGLYMISREKKNMTLQIVGNNPWDQADPCNAGITHDELVGAFGGVMLRRVTYHCPLRNETFRFITTERTLRPGVIAHLYRMRWNIEKVFDELKNKLGEKKAWATSPDAKSAQALFLCLAHNLMVLFEGHLEKTHHIVNKAEVRRRANRHRQQAENLAKDARQMPHLITLFQSLTVRSVKFIRWLRTQLYESPHEAPNLASLERVLATM
jgi:hypothetical protein